MSKDSFKTKTTLEVAGKSYEIFDITGFAEAIDLPFSLKILLENLLRTEDGANITADQIKKLAAWDPSVEPDTEIQFTPARVIMQDFTGVPCIVDLATMREAIAELDGDPAKLADGVFIGPAAVLTNDQYPRAINPDGSLKSASDWDSVGVTINEGASIGARAVCIAPVTIGAWALIAAGAVVNKDVPDFALMAGVPAKQIGWMSKFGEQIKFSDDLRYVCPHTGSVYLLRDNSVEVGM